MQSVGNPSNHGLENHGLHNLRTIYWNLTRAQLIEQAVANNEGHFSADGAFIVQTGKHTGRSPNDKYVVQYPGLEDLWWGKVNVPISSEMFERV